MKNLLRYLAFVLMFGGASAQSSLPACQGSDISRWSNCFGTTRIGNFYRYDGEYKDGKYNGLGTVTYANGESYVGDFKDGSRNGYGTSILANAAKYVGE